MPTQETPSPGQRCYAAYTAALALTFPRTWEDVSPPMQAAWEAAAQAVLNRRKEHTMRQGHFEEHWNDADGNPAGGTSSTRGATISWQHGPLGRGETRREPNGAFVEDLIQIVLGRLRFYQQSRFACDANQEAIACLEMAAEALDRRTRDREAREVEGTHHA